MKRTVEIPDELFERAKATAALQGENLEDFVKNALEAHLDRLAKVSPSGSGWRSVFGKADPEEVAAVDAMIRDAFERVELADWR